MLPPNAQEAIDEIDAWAAKHEPFLSAVWCAFAPQAIWPRAGDLKRELFQQGTKLDVERMARSMPPELGRPEAPEQRIRLTVRALARIPGARDLCEQLVGVVRELVMRYGSRENEAVVRSSEFESLLGIDHEEAARLEELCLLEGWVLSPQGGTAGDIQFGFNDHVIFHVADVATADEYLQAQAVAWWPELDELAESMAFQAIDQAPEPEPVQPFSGDLAVKVGDLHPIIAAAAARLVADGYLREAIGRAVVALQDAIRARANLPSEDGDLLMARTFNPKNGRLRVADVSTPNGANLQRGTMLLAQGVVAAIRNPAAHRLVDPGPVETLEQLAMLSFIARQLDTSTPIAEDDGGTA